MTKKQIASKWLKEIEIANMYYGTKEKRIKAEQFEYALRQIGKTENHND